MKFVTGSWPIGRAGGLAGGRHIGPNLAPALDSLDWAPLNATTEILDGSLKIIWNGAGSFARVSVSIPVELGANYNVQSQYRGGTAYARPSLSGAYTRNEPATDNAAPGEANSFDTSFVAVTGSLFFQLICAGPVSIGDYALFDLVELRKQ